MERAYSKELRREFIRKELERKFSKMSYRDIAREVERYFGVSAPSTATIQRDLKYLAEVPTLVSGDALELLDPEKFPEWRAEFFVAPNGKPYLTPDYQHALFWVIIALAMRRPLPQWVIDYWEFPPDINEDIEKAVKLFTMMLLVAPRHGKTELVIHALVWLICAKPNIRIIYCQGILSTSKEAMGLVQMELEQNDKLIDAYGPFKDDSVKWNSDMFWVTKSPYRQKSPTFRPVGIQSNIRSQDADIIIVDDPQDLDRATSETLLDRDYKWTTMELMTRREQETPVFMVGSHLPSPFGDLWSQIEENADALETSDQTIIIRKLPAHSDERCEGEPHEYCVAWPGFRTYGFLMAQRALLGDQMFDAVYQQNPRPDGLRYFDVEVLRGYYVLPTERDEKGAFKVPPLPEGQSRYGILDYTRSWKNDEIVCCGPIVHALGFDPAASERKGGSFSALVYKAACVKCKRRFYIDWWAKQQSPERNPDTIGSFTRAYPRVRRVRVEKNAYQKSLARDPRLREYARDHKFYVDEWRTDDRKNDPALGVPNLHRWMQDGLVSMPAKSQADVDYARGLTAYHLRYPRTPSDAVMADWLCDGALDEMIKEETVYTPEYTPGREHVPPALLANEYEIDLAI